MGVLGLSHCDGVTKFSITDRGELSLGFLMASVATMITPFSPESGNERSPKVLMHPSLSGYQGSHIAIDMCVLCRHESLLSNDACSGINVVR